MTKLTRLCGGGTVVIGLLLLAAVPGWGQQPTQEQIGAIRHSCRSDYIEHCSHVPTGGAAALSCLQRNEAQLSAACRQAVAAVGGGGARGGAMAQGGGSAPGAGMPPQGGGGGAAELFREECGPDVRRICRGVLPGGGRTIACLAENRASLSPACRQALMELRERR